MTEQLIAPIQPGTMVREHQRTKGQLLRDLPGPHAVHVADHVFALVEHAPDRRVEGSLFDLALAVGCDLGTARQAVASLDAADYVVSTDIRRATAEEPWQLTWAPVSGIVNLMLDWDLHTLDIAIEELSDWLGVPDAITVRALDWLASTPGVTVRRGAGSQGVVRVAIVLDECPHTAPPPAAG